MAQYAMRISEVARIIGASAADHAQQEAMRARLVVAGRLRLLLETHLRDLRSDVRKVVEQTIPGTSRTLADFYARAAHLQAGTPAARRQIEPRIPVRIAAPWAQSLEDALEDVIRQHEAAIANLLEHNAVFVQLGDQVDNVRHEGSRAEDTEWNRLAAALLDWMDAHGGVDRALAVRFFEFLGFCLDNPGDPKSQREALRLKGERLSAAANRHRATERTAAADGSMSAPSRR